jgi:transcriptional regulator with XRE-family HTH domain
LEQGLYQAQLAKHICVDEMTIVNWEKDRTVARGERLRRLARALGLREAKLT